MSHLDLFATPIWGFSLNKPGLVERCAEALRALRATNPSVSKSNLLGWQSADDLHELAPFTEVAEAIEQYANQVIRETYPKVVRYELCNLWGNINPPHAANLGHVHEHALSGAYYLEVPPDSGRLAFLDPRIRNRGEQGEDRVFNIATAPGGCVLFPAWLEHFVEPNRSDAERLSLAFNLKAHLG